MALSVISILAYTVAALLTFRKIYIVRARDAMHRYHGESSTERVPETEAQIKQWERLLSQREDAKKVNPTNSQQTFKLEWPGNGDRRSTIGTLRNLPRAARNAYESRGNSVYGRPDSVVSATTQMDPVVEEASLDPRLGPLPARAYTPPNYNEEHIPGIVNTRYTASETPQAPTPNPPQLQQNGYPLEKPAIQDSNTQHPLERSQNQYRMVDEHRPAIEYRMAPPEEQPRSLSRGSARSRESTRMEIELADRGRSRDMGDRSDMDGVEVIRSIRRVETDGWGIRHGY